MIRPISALWLGCAAALTVTAHGAGARIAANLPDRASDRDVAGLVLSASGAAAFLACGLASTIDGARW